MANTRSIYNMYKKLYEQKAKKRAMISESPRSEIEFLSLLDVTTSQAGRPIEKLTWSEAEKFAKDIIAADYKLSNAQASVAAKIAQNFKKSGDTLNLDPTASEDIVHRVEAFYKKIHGMTDQEIKQLMYKDVDFSDKLFLYLSNYATHSIGYYAGSPNDDET